jgi:protein phosphatase
MVLGAALEREIPSADDGLRVAELLGVPDNAAPTSEPGAEQTAAEPSSHAGERPVGAAAVLPDGDDEARYSPQAPRPRSRRRSWAAVILAVVVVGAALASAYAWTRTQFYVGVAGTQVAIFQGLDENLPGVRLSRLFEVQPLAVSALPPYYQERVRASIDVASLSAARQTVGELTTAARRCAQAAPSAPPRVLPSPAASTAARPSTAAAATSTAIPNTVRPSTVRPSTVPPGTVRTTAAARPTGAQTSASRPSPTSLASSESATPGPDC